MAVIKVEMKLVMETNIGTYIFKQYFRTQQQNGRQSNQRTPTQMLKASKFNFTVSRPKKTLTETVLNLCALWQILNLSQNFVGPETTKLSLQAFNMVKYSPMLYKFSSAL